MYLHKFVPNTPWKYSIFFFKLWYIDDIEFISEFTYIFINVTILSAIQNRYRIANSSF